MSLRYLTAGESHGKALLGIIEGLPAGIPISQEALLEQMRRRKMGYGRGRRMQIEDDAVEILAGVRHAETLGSPIGVILPNKDWRNWQDIMQPEAAEGTIKRQVSVPRPGHADLVGAIKYGYRDLRNSLERSSARHPGPQLFRIPCQSSSTSKSAHVKFAAHGGKPPGHPYGAGSGQE